MIYNVECRMYNVELRDKRKRFGTVSYKKLKIILMNLLPDPVAQAAPLRRRLSLRERR